MIPPSSIKVIVPRTFLYPRPDLKLAPAVAISLVSQVVIVAEKETQGTRYAILKSGKAMIFPHIKPLDQTERDYVTVAEQFIRTPYLWGGVSGFGMDLFRADTAQHGSFWQKSSSRQ